jgi:hypothetical protein
MYGCTNYETWLIKLNHFDNSFAYPPEMSPEGCEEYVRRKVATSNRHANILLEVFLGEVNWQEISDSTFPDKIETPKLILKK